MRVKKEIAELMGIILGDGSLYFNKKFNIYQLVITGHIKNDFLYYKEYVLPLLEKNFGKKFKLKLDLKNNVIRIKSQNKSIIKKINNLGIPIGNKVKNNIKIPDWIFINKNFLKACIRGLIETDGSLCPITGRNYSYIWFKSKISGLRKSFSRAMNILEIRTSKWNFVANQTPSIFIGAKSMIEKYFNEIGFNNPYYINRFKLPSSSPVKEG